MPKPDDDLFHLSEDQLSDKLVIAELGGRVNGLLTAKTYLLELAGKAFQEQAGHKSPDDSYAISLRQISQELGFMAGKMSEEQESRITKYKEDYSED